MLHALHARQPLPEHPHAKAAAHYTAEAAKIEQGGWVMFHGARAALVETPPGLYLPIAEARKLQCVTVDLRGAKLEVLVGNLDGEPEPEVYAVDVSGYWMRVVEAFADWLQPELDAAAVKSLEDAE